MGDLEWEALDIDSRLDFLRLEVLGVTKALSNLRANHADNLERTGRLENDIQTALRWLAKFEDRFGDAVA
jgi:hypothetical protein